MTGDGEIKDEKIQYNINREAAKKNQVKLIGMNILQVKKYCLLTEDK